MLAAAPSRVAPTNPRVTVVLACAGNEAAATTKITRGLVGHGLRVEVVADVDLDIEPLRAAIARVPADARWLLCQSEELDEFQGDLLRLTLSKAGVEDVHVKTVAFDPTRPSRTLAAASRWLRSVGAIVRPKPAPPAAKPAAPGSGSGTASSRIKAAPAVPRVAPRSRTVAMLSVPAPPKVAPRGPTAPAAPKSVVPRSTTRLMLVPSPEPKLPPRPQPQPPKSRADDNASRRRASTARLGSTSEVVPQPEASEPTPASPPPVPAAPKGQWRPVATQADPPAPAVVARPLGAPEPIDVMDTGVLAAVESIFESFDARDEATTVEAAAPRAEVVAPESVASEDAAAEAAAPEAVLPEVPVLAEVPTPVRPQSLTDVQLDGLTTSGSWIASRPVEAVDASDPAIQMIRRRAYRNGLLLGGLGVAAAGLLALLRIDGGVPLQPPDSNALAVVDVALPAAPIGPPAAAVAEVTNAADPIDVPEEDADLEAEPAPAPDQAPPRAEPVLTLNLEDALASRAVRALDELVIATPSSDPVFRNAAARTCSALVQGGVESWRLPDSAELVRLANAGFIEARDTVWTDAGRRKPAKRAIWNGRSIRKSWVGRRVRADLLCVAVVD